MTADERIAVVMLKVQRAKKHIFDLNTEIKSFQATKPYKIGAKRNPETQQVIFYLDRVEPTPAGLTVLAGDAIQNLRTALDHLAQQLFVVGNKRVGASQDVYFPTDSNAAQFKAAAPGKVKGWRQDAIDNLFLIEPYDGGKGSGLSVLNRLNRIDKHRMLVAVSSMVAGVDHGPSTADRFRREFAAMGKQITLPDFSLVIRPAYTGPAKAGDEVLIAPPDTEMDDNIKFGLDIALHEPGVVEGEPVLKTLQDLADLVRVTIESFRPCLN